MAIVDVFKMVSAGAGACGFCTEPMKLGQKGNQYWTPSGSNPLKPAIFMDFHRPANSIFFD